VDDGVVTLTRDSTREAPTAAELVARARAMRPLLLERQAETEQLTHYPPATHEEFLGAGFYRMLVPRRYGGYEQDLPTFWRVVMEVARGCPSSAWSLCLASGHALQVASIFGGDVQEEVFGDGDFLAAAVAAPAGSARPTDGGWVINSTHPYSSGAPFSTHYVGQTFGPAGADGAPTMLLFVAPRSAWTVLDDWGSTLGLKGSGSHSVRFENAHLPARYVLENAWLLDMDPTNGTPGSELHGNPMYRGRWMSFFQGELASVMTGAARGALDEYEALLRSRKTQRPPIVDRAEDPDYQRWFGLALGRVATAEAALIQCAEQWMELCRASAEDAVPFTRADDMRLNVIAREALTLAWDAMAGQIFRTAGTSAARNGERMERIFRDMAIGWGHFGTVLGDWAARELAREHLGLGGQVPRPDRPRTEREQA
jgi:3-hydroxy-9,10-secoandrosta-1,3,5(10)-triene-9,17-dione monooxygenase